MKSNIHSSSYISASAVFWMRAWLLVLGLMVYAMILVGGATRLTDSGLSITEWDPIAGALPPMSEAAWIALFEKYKQTAEYQLQNKGMSLSEFEFIYWWEWGHRLLGRIIGLVAILGYVVFAMKGWLQRGLKWKFLALIFLGGLQGFIGWWMVASGIGETNRVDVAPYRLMVHFSLALLIICYIYWLWQDITLKTVRLRSSGLVFPILLVLVFLQMASGALVAGMDAGRTYTDWPRMAGEFFPTGYWMPKLGLLNLVENQATVQFNHRMLAYFIVAVIVAMLFWFKSALGRYGLKLVAFLIVLQVAWGIFTLINVAPLHLALVHQGIGVLVLLSCVRTVWRSGHITGYS